MAIAPAVLLVELVMSADRLIQAAQKAPDVDGEWSPATIIGHLSQVDEQVWTNRLEVMLNAQAKGEPAPGFVWWEPDPVETAELFAKHTVEEAGAQLMTTRTHLLTRLRELTPEQWEAQANHDTWGEIDVTGLLLRALAHDEEHRGTLVYRKPQ